MGVPLLVTTNGGFTYWPEIIEEGDFPSNCDCCSNENGSSGATDEMAAVDRRKTGEEDKEMSDLILMEKSLAEFAVKAREKFKQGIEEHNPNGDKGLLRMSLNQKLTAIREEIIDLWFYVAAIEAATSGKDVE